MTAYATVRARIAAAAGAQSPVARAGAYVLRDMQRRSLAAIHAALRAHGGALVADAAGSGKTVLALATAASYADALAIVPAALRDQWQRAAQRAGVALRITTHEQLSRGRLPPAAPLIIVDEAHHFRSVASARYRALAALGSGRHLVLLTATPVVNRIAERDALLALFLGSTRPSTAVLGRVVLRHVRGAAVPVTRVADALPAAADVPAIGEAIEALPPPLPLADGSAATALVRMTLAFAWASSLAALDVALRRRIQRGCVLRDALQDGRWPSRDALRDWIAGPDATQLALPLRLAGSGRGSTQEAVVALDLHLAAVQALRAIVAMHLDADSAARATALRRLLDAESPRRIVVLAHHAATVRMLYGQLRDQPGTVAIVGERVLAAAGRWTRDEILRRLGPGAPPWRPRDPQGIRLLVATDILAEGVELQGCATLVHGDPAWTPARVEQREARLARDGQRDDVRVLRFSVPAGAERLLDLHRRLRNKRRARRAALRRPDAHASLQTSLSAWRSTADDASARDAHPGFVAAAALARCDGFIALLESDGRAQLVAGYAQGRRWRIGTGTALVARCIAAVDGPVALPAQHLLAARRLLRVWLRRRRSSAAVSKESALAPEILRRASVQMDAWLVAQPVARRMAAAEESRRLRAGLAALRGIGAERALRAALALDDGAARIHALRQLAPNVALPREGAAPRLSALLVLRRPAPAAPAPPAPLPGSAATR